MLARNGIFRAILPLDQELSWAIQHRKGKEFRNAIYKLSLAAALYFLRGGSNLRIFQCKSRELLQCVLQSLKLSGLSLASGSLRSSQTRIEGFCDAWFLDTRIFRSNNY